MQLAVGLLGTTSIAVGRGTSSVSAWTGSMTNSVFNQAKSPSKTDDLRIIKVDPWIARFNKDGTGALTGGLELERHLSGAFLEAQSVDPATAERA